jgi:hypothetical protein
MFKTTTREMKSKVATIAKGERVKVAFDVKLKAGGFAQSAFSVSTEDGRRISTRDLKAVGLKMPGLKTLEKYSSEGIAKSVFGARVEPDGVDAEGSPSWLLFAGLI